MPDSNTLFLDMFSDRERIAHHADGPRHFTPGLDAVHRMTELLLAEHAPRNAHVRVLGAGGGHDGDHDREEDKQRDGVGLRLLRGAR